MASPPYRLIHKNDIQWIIELWHRIHDGDPAPQRLDGMSEHQVQAVLTQVIQQFAAHLPADKGKAVNAALGH